MPLYFHHIRHYSIIATGFALLPLVGLIPLGSYLPGKFVSSKGAKFPLLLGFLISAAGFFGFIIAQELGQAYFWLIIPLAAIGFGVSFCQPAATTIAIHAAPHNRAGIASAIFTTSRQVGSLAGIALFGSIIQAAHSFLHGMHITLIIAGLFSLGALLLSATLAGKH